MISVSVRAGHTLLTPGKCTPTGIKERQLNEKVKKEVIRLLKLNGFKVLDVSSPIDGKESRTNDAKKSNNFGADIHIEIHHNAMTATTAWQIIAKGIETWYFSKSENGKKLANFVQKHVINETKQKNRGIKPNRTWTMLKDTEAIAVLPELGFMDSKSDLQKILTFVYTIQCARGIVKGVCEFMGMNFSESEVGEVERITKSVLPLVKEFQQQEGLVVDGIIGPKTWAAITEYKSEYTRIYKGLEKLQENLMKLKEGK